MEVEGARKTAKAGCRLVIVSLCAGWLAQLQWYGACRNKEANHKVPRSVGVAFDAANFFFARQSAWQAHTGNTRCLHIQLYPRLIMCAGCDE